MKRIAVIQDFWRFTPEPQDFVEYNAQILMNSMFNMYALKNGKVEMLHHFQIEDIAKHKNRTTTGIAKVLLSYIENIPESLWQDVTDELKLCPLKK